MVKITALYGHPADPEAFETYYAETHGPIVMKIPNVKRFEIGKAIATPGQDRPVFYRIAEMWFDSMEQLQEAVASPEGQAIAQDLPNFATGGVTLTIAETVDLK